MEYTHTKTAKNFANFAVSCRLGLVEGDSVIVFMLHVYNALIHYIESYSNKQLDNEANYVKNF